MKESEETTKGRCMQGKSLGPGVKYADDLHAKDLASTFSASASPFKSGAIDMS